MKGCFYPNGADTGAKKSVSSLLLLTRPGGVGRFLSSSTAAASAAVHTVSPSRDKTTNLLGAPSPETAAFAGTGITDYGLSPIPTASASATVKGNSINRLD